MKAFKDMTDGELCASMVMVLNAAPWNEEEKKFYLDLKTEVAKRSTKLQDEIDDIEAVL